MMRTTFRVLVALLLAAIIWWIGPMVAIGIYHPFGSELLRQVLVICVLLWGFWPLLRWIWRSIVLNARKIQPRTKTRSYDAIQGKLSDLERRLRARWLRTPRSRLQTWRGWLLRSHNQFMPWFLVLGAEGSGKTRLVAQGLAPDALHPGAAGGSSPVPYNAADFAGDAEANGSELECWLSSQAVWLDTTGSWSMRDSLSDSGHSAWQQMLRGIRKLRRDPALNGVVLCVDTADLTASSLEQRKRLAESLRARLDELHHQFGQCMQVYIALTGLDKLDGAAPLLGLMSPAQWVQGMGYALAQQQAPHSDAEMPAWQIAWLELENRVQQQVLYASPTSGGIAENIAQLQFVEAMGRLRGPLFDMLRSIFVAQEDEGVARLRGAWLGSVADLEGRSEQEADQEPQTMSSLALLWRPLLRQMLDEHEMAWKGVSLTWKARLVRGMRWGLVSVLASLALGWMAWGYLAERNQLEWVWAQFTEGKRLAQTESDVDAAASTLLHVSSQMRYARAHVDEAEQALSTPYVEHRRLIDVATETYHRHLQKSLMPELHNLVQRTLDSQVNNGLGDIYLTLKIYLMLADPARRQPDDLERWINGQWDRIAVGQYNEDDKRALQGHLRVLFSIPGVPGTPLDSAMVQSARAKAAQIPSVTRVIHAIQDQGLPSNVSDVSLASAAGYGTAMVLRMRSNMPITDVAIPGWYTRAGYLEVFLQRLNTTARAILAEESWVLRDEPLQGNSFEIDRQVQVLADATRRQYLQDYDTHWQSFLKDVTVRSYTGLDDAAQIAANLMDPQSSLAQLIRFTARETLLIGSYDGDVDTWIEKQKYRLQQAQRSVVGEISGQRLRNALPMETTLQDHYEALRAIARQLRQPDASAANNPLSRLFEPLYRQLGLVNGATMAGQVLPQYDAFARLRGVAGRQPEPVRGIMLDLVTSGGQLSVKESGVVLTRGAAQTTRMVCDQGVSGRYPMLRSSKNEVGVQDYERLFGSQGAMASYFRDQLASYVDTTRSPWQARRTQDSGGPLLNAEVLRSFETAERIRNATLDESNHLRVSAILHLVDMDPQLAEAQLDLTGQTLRYAHGTSAPRRIDWGSQNNNLSIRLSLRSVDGRTEVQRFDGPWALFRFFDAGQATESGADRKETKYQTNLGTVRVEWQAVTLPSPLWSGLLASFRCPR